MELAMTKNLARYRHDYQTPAYLVSAVQLSFVLDPNKTRVTAVSQYRQQRNEPLVLDGQLLTLISVQVNGTDWPFQQTDSSLTLCDLPAAFSLSVVTDIAPAQNTALEGLYMSDGAYCTQCEAEGFRRITYYQDRPDVMAVFTTDIIAPAGLEFMLANGNQVANTLLPDGRRHVSWHDPFPKPCYLFALVAGNFDELTDVFVTQSGREVSLRFYVDKGKAAQASFALAALQRAMRFDEERYGLEYDLDIYMVVAVDFFNMGAMENKGLNIFNSKYVLADPQTATDQDYYLIESIIAHEYFHNWTGNRVTCRDWFQLSLKEGLTVFRDQEFSAAMGSPALCRIDAIKTIRTAQFAEDSGPMAHPIRPERVEEMNNFYTVTVYDKGAEVIRMQQTLLSAAGFRRGMDLYFARHDGQAVTCDDFVQAMQDANQVDLTQFRLWYSQSGTPRISACLLSNGADTELVLSQHTEPTADQADKQPLLIPLRFELHDDNGLQFSGLLQFNQPEQRFVFHGLTGHVVPVLLADFSAPVKLDYPYSLSDLLFLVAQAADPVARWDAMQTIWLQLCQQSVAAAAVQPLPAALVSALTALVRQPLADLAFTAELLTLPSLDTLTEQFSHIPLDMLMSCREHYQQHLAVLLGADWLVLYQRLAVQPYQYNQQQVGIRALRNTALSYLLRLGAQHDSLWQQQLRHADNMTDKLAVLSALVQVSHPATAAQLATFVAEAGSDVQLFDKFAQLCARRQDDGVWQQLDAVTQMPQFDWQNPNRVRALYYVFAMQNTRRFHQPDGQGYQLLASVIRRADAVNPQLASRLVTPLLAWRRYDAVRAHGMQQALLSLQQMQAVSPDLAEKLQKALHD